MRVSISDLRGHDQCPRLWFGARRGELDDSSRLSRVGRACGVGCEAVVTAAVNEPERPPHEVARSAVLAHGEESKMPDRETDEALGVMDQALQPGSAVQIAPSGGWSVVAGYVVNLDAEMRPTSEDGSYSARIDSLRMQTDLRLVEALDWSTSEDHISGEELSSDDKALWEAFVALQLFPDLEVVTVKRSMLRLLYTCRAEIRRDDPRIARVVERMRRLRAAALRARDTAGVGLVEQHGSWCGGCPRRGVCVGRDKAVGRGALLADADRSEVARRRDVLRKSAEELDAWLRDDVRRNGPIPMPGDKVLDFHAEKRFELRGTVAETMDKLRGWGLNAGAEAEIFSPREKALPGLVREAIKAIIPNRGAQQAFLDELLAPAQAFSFETRKARM